MQRPVPYLNLLCVAKHNEQGGNELVLTDYGTHPFGSACDGYIEVNLLPGPEQSICMVWSFETVTEPNVMFISRHFLLNIVSCARALVYACV